MLNATIISDVAAVPTLNNIATVNLTALVPMTSGLNLALGTTSAATVGDVNSVGNTLAANDTLSGGTGATDVLVLTGAPRAADGGGATSAVAFDLTKVTGVTGVQLNGGNAGR